METEERKLVMWPEADVAEHQLLVSIAGYKSDAARLSERLDSLQKQVSDRLVHARRTEAALRKELAANLVGPTVTATEALAFIRRLADEENGAVVSSSACSEMEIAFARAEGRFWVDPQTACGYVLRPKRWREKAEEALRDESTGVEPS